MQDKNKAIAYQFDLQKKEFHAITIEQFDLTVFDENNIFWMHLPLDASVYPLLTTLGINITILENNHLNGKIIEEKDYLFTSVDLWKFDNNSDRGNIIKFVICLSQRGCITLSDSPTSIIEDLIKNLATAITFAKTPAFILFLLVDSILNAHTDNLSKIEFCIHEANQKISPQQIPMLVKYFNKLKREVIYFKYSVFKVEDMIMKLSSRKFLTISLDFRQSLNELYQYSALISKEIDTYLYLINDSLFYLNNLLTQELNNTMRRLTCFTAIFLPITCIVGIYGMNFKWMPELTWKYGYLFAIGLIIAAGTSVLYFFKYKKWL